MTTPAGLVRSLCLYLFVALGASHSALAQPAPAAPAAAPSPPLPDATKPAALSVASTEPALTQLLTRQRDALGRSCELQQLASKGPLRFLACGAAGLWIVRVLGDDASIVDMQDLGGRVGPFFEANGRLWVEISSVRAQEVNAGVFELSTPPIAAAPKTFAEAAARARVSPVKVPSQPTEPDSYGRVVARSDELLVIAIPGPRLKLGRHVALVSSSYKANPDEQVFAVGEVVKSSLNRAHVAIGMNESVPDDADARPTDAPLSGSIFAPERAGGVWEIGFLARPFLVLEDLGVGGMLDAYAGYRFKAPFHIEASLFPLAFATARAGAAGVAGAFVSGAYDSHLFEVGLGLGGQTVNDPDFALDPGSGLLLAQRLRLGARDGAHIAFVSYVTLFHSNFQFSSLRVDVQIPVGARTWLRLAGGGGSLGLGYGELGLRALLSGNGGAGSFFLTTVIGWAQVFRDCNDSPQLAGVAANGCNSIDYNGPMLGAGGEFRL